ncbi:hypothetical protein BC834DRAFT_896141 [Gloeopeniophorella convolvens]|nr:hypothetical protein BC834DRAFT_896141 [Gloeopeniophorella convolvens]
MPPRPAQPDPPLHSPANYALHTLLPTLLSYMLGATTLHCATHKVCPAPALAALICAAFINTHWVPLSSSAFAGATVVCMPELCRRDVHFWVREHGAGTVVWRVCAWRQRQRRSGCYRMCLRAGSARLRAYSHVCCVEHVGVCMHCIVSLS